MFNHLKCNFRLGEEVYAQEKTDLKKSIGDLEAKLKTAAAESLEHASLKERLEAITEQLKQVEVERDGLKKQAEEMAVLQAKLETSENQKAEFEFQFHEENAKLVELGGRLAEVQARLEQKNEELVKLKVSQNQSETDVEFALEEQKVLVQELEKDLASKSKELDEARAAESKKVNDLVREL